MPEFSDADFRQAMLRALRLVVVMAAVAAAFVGWRLGWRSAAMLLVGAAISGSGVWEWLRLMTVVMARMDAAEIVACGPPGVPCGPSVEAGDSSAAPAAAVAAVAVPTADATTPVGLKTPRMTGVLLTFFLRLGLIAVVLYATLRYLEGSVLALAAGLALGAFALVVEGIRLVRAWT